MDLSNQERSRNDSTLTGAISRSKPNRKNENMVCENSTKGKTQNTEIQIEAGERLFRIVKLLMILTGTWQLDMRISERWKAFFKLYNHLYLSVCLYGIMTIFIRGIEVFFVEQNFDLGFELVSYFILFSMSTLKTRLCQSREMTKLIQEGIKQSNLEAHADSSIKKIYLSHLIFSNFFPLFLFCYNMLICSYYFAKDISNIKTFRQEHEDGQQPVHLLGCWCPFNTTEYFSYCLTMEQTVSLVLSCYTCVSYALFITIITLCLAQIKVLQYNFQHFCCHGLVKGEAVSQQEVQANLKECVRKHQRIISYIRSLNESWKYILLLEYLISSLMFAGALLQILRSNHDQFYYIFYLSYLVMQLTIICYIAEDLRMQSMKIGDAIFRSKWYEYNNEVKQIMLIVMIRTRKPLSLTIGPFGPLTSDVVVTRLKLAYSYMSLIERTIGIPLNNLLSLDRS